MENEEPLPPRLRKCLGCNLICCDPEEFPNGKAVCVFCQKRMNKTL